MAYIKKSLRYLLVMVLSFIGFVLLYFLSAFLLTILPCNRSSIQPSSGIEVYIASNGVHTDIVVPVHTSEISWDSIIPVSHFRPEASSSSYISFGWGDKGFYLSTPTWAELKLSTALRAMSGDGTAMHVAYEPGAPVLSDKARRLVLSRQQYKQLIAYIRSSFLLDSSGKCILIDCCRYAGMNDSFYEGKGTYYMFKTCNVWTNGALKEIGVKTACWAPFASCVLYHLPAGKAFGYL